MSAGAQGGAQGYIMNDIDIEQGGGSSGVQGGAQGYIINDVDIEQGGGLAGSSASPPPSASGGILAPHDDDNGALLLRKQKKWIKEMRGYLVVVASLAANLAYQLATTAPGGFWQDDKGGPNGHTAGQAVMGSKEPGSYVAYKELNTMAFLTSMIIMGLVCSERFYGTPTKMAALMLLTLVDVGCLVTAFIFSCSPNYPQYGAFDILFACIICFLVFLAVCIGVATWRFLRCLYHVAQDWWCPDKAEKLAEARRRRAAGKAEKQAEQRRRRAAKGKQPCCPCVQNFI